MQQIDSNVPLPLSQPVIEPPRKPIETHTVRQAMAALNMGHTSIYELAKRGDITIIKVLGKSLIIDLREYIERQADEARRVRAAN